MLKAGCGGPSSFVCVPKLSVTSLQATFTQLPQKSQHLLHCVYPICRNTSLVLQTGSDVYIVSFSLQPLSRTGAYRAYVCVLLENSLNEGLCVWLKPKVSTHQSIPFGG